MFFLLTRCRDGRIKVIGGDNIEAILASPKQLPFKNLEVCGILFISWYFERLQSRSVSKYWCLIITSV